MAGERGTVEQAGELHGRLVALMLEILEKGEVVPVPNKETGEIEYRAVTPSPAMLAQINAFLKNNNITVVVSRSRPMQNLAAAFQDFNPPDLSGPDYATN